MVMGSTTFLAIVIAVFMVACEAVSVEELETMVTNLQTNLGYLQQANSMIVRELRENQYRADEMTRSSGSSGLKTIKGLLAQGTKAYYRTGYSSTNVASIHDHANHLNTAGMGEATYIINGFEGRSRHNDFMLRSKSLTSPDFGATTEIDFPPVPPEVTNQPTVEAEIAEMKEWFKAFHTQTFTERDYRPYFQPMLCYLEGTWIQASNDDDTIEEIFFSDRHSLNATTWAELEDRINFSAFTGRDDELEGLSYNPQRFIGQDANGVPIVARWIYQILCHKLNNDLQTNRLRAVDDVKSRMALSSYLSKSVNMADLEASRLARYQLNTLDNLFFAEDSGRRYTLLDTFMQEIPGMDNYNAVLADDTFDVSAFEFSDPTIPLNAAYYHRSFQVSDLGAMGTKTRGRAFNDPFVYMAMTTHPEVAAAHFENEGFSETQRWSYAIPLEILYMTPLSNWNPYNIAFHGWKGDPGTEVVEAGNRNGNSPAKAYSGTHSKTFFRTPFEFFTNATDLNADAADTSGDIVYVEDASGTVRAVRGSGTRIILPEIEGVGRVRTRYPISSMYEEGSATWMETKALADILLEPTKFAAMSREYVPDPNAAIPCTTHIEPLSFDNAEDTAVSNLEMQMSSGTFTDVTFYIRNLDDTDSGYEVVISAADIMALCADHLEKASLTTTTVDDNFHLVEVKKTVSPANEGANRIKYVLNDVDGGHANDVGLERRIYMLPA